MFHYHLPPELEHSVKPGFLVAVPFGKQTVQGVVIKIVGQPEVAQTKPVLSLLDPRAVLTPAQIEFTVYLSEAFYAPLAACVQLMIPPGLSQQADTLFSLAQETHPAALAGLQKQLVEILQQRGALRGRQIDRALPRRNWRAAARTLVTQGLVESLPVLPPPQVRPKYIRTAQLAVLPEFARAQLQDLGATAATQERRQKIMAFLLKESVPVDVSWVYAESGGNLADLQRLNESGLIMLREEEAWRDPLAGIAYDPGAAPQLTADQQKVWQQLSAGIKSARQEKLKPYLLHGVTGSGKTEIYLRAVADTLKAGRQALILVPEIALTPQTVRRFMARFPGQVGLVHSRLSMGERYDTWRRARQGQLPVIVGPRSALFAPLPDIGLIVVDESHDESYYQSGPAPFYHAREAAAAYARINQAVCVLGSATPDVTSYQRAAQGQWQLLSLPSRILAHRETVKSYQTSLGRAAHYRPGEGDSQSADLPSVEVVEMRRELKRGNRSIFSQSLQQALGEVLDQGQQAILFLNRRGSATYVFCRDCGQSLRCPRCETPLSEHIGAYQGENHPAAPQQKAGKTTLLCHHCGYQRQLPPACPGCGSQRIRHFGAGTQRVEAEIAELFPQARTLRWDHETTRKKGAHEIILSHFTNRRADILIGTQMIAKGLDLPLVTLVGAVLADVGLQMPDYRAGERVFQVLTQVAGRAGRSPLGGKVILQTFDPDHYVIQAAAGHDYAGFAAQELDYRRKLGYPPFTQLVRLLYRHQNEGKARSEAENLAGLLRGLIRQQDRRATELIGPAPAYYTRLDGNYRWQLVLRGPDPVSLLPTQKLGDWQVEVMPQALL